MRRQLEFYISGIVTGVSGYLHIVGRNCADALCIGDTFETLYQRDESEPAQGFPTSGEKRSGHVKPVKLRVASLRAYENDLTELGPGLTGSIALTGQYGDEVAPGCLLGGVGMDTNMQSPQSVNAVSSQSSRE